MNPFNQKFTPLQSQKLVAAGFENLYSVITYLPFDLAKIRPLENIYNLPQEGVLYLYSGKLTNITHRTGGKQFLILDFEGEFSLRSYMFSVANYTLKALQIGQNYQLLLVFRGGFWNLEKFAIKSTPKESKLFMLGQALDREYLLPKYIKRGELRNSDLQALHRRLGSGDYMLNLEGLVPPNSFLPQVISLEGIHKPQTPEKYEKNLHQWISLKVFLRLSLLRYMDRVNSQSVAPAGNLDLKFLQKLTKKLPFELSQSQKTVVWDILQEITIVS